MRKCIASGMLALCKTNPQRSSDAHRDRSVRLLSFPRPLGRKVKFETDAPDGEALAMRLPCAAGREVRGAVVSALATTG